MINFSLNMKYLGIILDKNGNFKEYLGMVSKRAEKIMISLTMLNLRESTENRRKLLANWSSFMKRPVWTPAVHWVLERLEEVKKI